MKAIILAAGMGTRLGNYTENLPKGLLSFDGKSLLEYQINTLRNQKVNDISIVRGYNPEKIQFPGIKYYQNDEFQDTNMVASLFCAEAELEGDVLVCYSDIVYEDSLLKTIIDANIEVGVTVDEDYLDYWKARLDQWEKDLETLQLNEQGNISKLGTPTRNTHLAQLRYIGLIKFSAQGIHNLKKVFHENKKLFWNKDTPWLNSSNFKKAYFTDILQAMINAGHVIKPIRVKHGWMEFDTVEDYEKATKWVEEGSINRFIQLQRT